MFSGFTYQQPPKSEHTETARPCYFMDLCESCHSEPEMIEKRKSCSELSSKKCGVYWAFMDGYLGLDEE